MNNVKIAKNTFSLYLRMLLSLGISLYTSRVVLNSFGIEDYGIYNVVGGVVTMFTFLNSSMSSATQRFLTFEIGKGNNLKLNKVFNFSLIIHGVIAVIIVVLAETIGLWFLYNYMNIPSDRMNAAFWVYQLSILSCVLSIFNVPFNALIIAYEQMSVFIFISIFEVLAKLIVAFLISYAFMDKLIFYSSLLCLTVLSSTIIYIYFCKRNFKLISFDLKWDGELFKSMISFATWTLWGNIANIAFNQGLNVLLNIFFGPVVNAARGIAVQVQSAISSFVVNFQTAINPQITKAYATEETKLMHSLIFASTKISMYLLIMIALPVYIHVEFLLQWWLKIIPDHTTNFIRLILILSIIDAISNPLIVAVQATGRIKLYQIAVGGILLLIVPLSYFALKFSAIPEVVFFVHILIYLFAQFLRLLFVQKLIGLLIVDYLKQVVLRVLSVIFLSSVLPIYIYANIQDLTYSFILVLISSLISVVFFTYFIGLSFTERVLIKEKIVKLLGSSLRAKE